MNMRRVSNDGKTIHKFMINSDRRGFRPGIKPEIVGEDTPSTVPTFGYYYGLRGGFRKIVLEIETDDSNKIIQFYAVIDVYFIPPGYQVFDKEPVKMGRVNFSGTLIPGKNQLDEPEWNTQIIVSCPFTKANADTLPAIMRQKEIGPAALITGVIQSLFGTTEGIKLLGLEGYEIPDADAGLTNIKTMATGATGARGKGLRPGTNTAQASGPRSAR